MYSVCWGGVRFHFFGKQKFERDRGSSVHVSYFRAHALRNDNGEGRLESLKRNCVEQSLETAKCFFHPHKTEVFLEMGRPNSGWSLSSHHFLTQNESNDGAARSLRHGEARVCLQDRRVVDLLEQSRRELHDRDRWTLGWAGRENETRQVSRWPGKQVDRQDNWVKESYSGKKTTCHSTLRSIFFFPFTETFRGLCVFGELALTSQQ